MTKSFSTDEYVQALDSWGWLDIGDKTPVLSSLFGDVFMRGADGYWFLDTVEGTLKRPWTTRDEVQAALDSHDGQDRYLLGGLAIAAAGAGLTLRPREVYSFRIHPRLGGAFEVANLTTMDFVVSVDIMGQIHEQVRNLPPGTKISGFKMSGPESA